MPASKKPKTSLTRDKMITFDEYVKEYAAKSMPPKVVRREDPISASKKWQTSR